MGTSSISITALTASPTLRGNSLTAAVSAAGPALNIPTLMLANVEFFASTTNDFTTATKVVEGNPEALHAGLIEEQTYYYWAKPRAVNGNYGAVFPVSPTGGVACTTIGQSGLAFGLANGKIVVDDHTSDATVASGALRIAIKTAAGADPSSSSPVIIAFKNADAASGGYAIRTIISAVSLTILSGTNVNNVAASQAFRIWVIAYDNGASNPVLAVAYMSGYTLLDEIFDLTSKAFIGFGGDNLDSTPCRAAVPATNRYRIVANCDWNTGLATPGTWVQPTSVRLFGPGSRRPGDVVQISEYNVTAVSFTGTGVIPFDDTIPQSGEGSFAAGQSFQRLPQKPNYIKLQFGVNVSFSVAAHITAAVFRGSGADAIRAAVHYVPAADEIVQIIVDDFRQVNAGTNGYNVNLGGDSAGTWRVGGASGARKLGGVLPDYWIQLTEIMG